MQAHALDRSAWWPVIDREGWDVDTTHVLLDVLDDALFGAPVNGR